MKKCLKNYDSARTEIADISEGEMKIKSEDILIKQTCELVVTYKVNK